MFRLMLQESVGRNGNEVASDEVADYNHLVQKSCFVYAVLLANRSTR